MERMLSPIAMLWSCKDKFAGTDFKIERISKTYSSNLRATKTNWRMLTAQKSSSSKDLSCLKLQMQIGMEIKLTKTKGTKTRIQKWRSDFGFSKLSATSNSNIKSSKCVAKLMSIALYWMYSSALRWFWGRRHQTIDPMIAPDTEKFKVNLCPLQ